MTVKSTNIPEINCHLWAVFSNLRAKTCTITQPTAAILCAREVCFPLKLIAWNYGYTTRTQPKIGRTKLKFSENSPSYELPPCCDVMGLSNLITVPDWCLHCLPAAILQDQGVEVPQHGGSILDFIFYSFTITHSIPFNQPFFFVRHV